jgi:hypothetical protein
MQPFIQIMATVPKMYIFPWESESLRESYQPIELYWDMSNSDEYNDLFTPRPLSITDFCELLGQLGEREFMHALKHARNATNGLVDFGEMLFQFGEISFQNIMIAYFRNDLDSPYAISDVEICVDVNYSDLRKHLGPVLFNRLLNQLEYNHSRCVPFFDNSYWFSVVAMYKSKSRNPAPPPSVLFNNESICVDLVAPSAVVNNQMAVDPMVNTQIAVDLARSFNDLVNDLAFGTDQTYLDYDVGMNFNTTLFDCDTNTDYGNTNTNTTDTIDTTSTTETDNTNRGSKRARVDTEPELGALDNDLRQQYTDIRAQYIASGCEKWFDENTKYLGCHLVPIQRGMNTKKIMRYCLICCCDVETPDSKFAIHLVECHPVFYNVLCLNKNPLTKFKQVDNLNSVLASYNRVRPCNCDVCIKKSRNV